jgi:hypothetical protein
VLECHAAQIARLRGADQVRDDLEQQGLLSGVAAQRVFRALAFADVPIDNGRSESNPARAIDNRRDIDLHRNKPTVLVPAHGFLQHGRTAHHGRINGGAFGLTDIGNDQLVDRAPARLGFAIAEQPLRASIPGLDCNVASDADDGIVRGGNDRGELGVAPLACAPGFSQPELPHGAADRAPEHFGIEAVLDKVVQCASLHGCGRNVGRRGPRQHHYGAWQCAVRLPQGLQRFEPRRIRQAVVEQNAIGRGGPSELQALLSVSGLLQHKPCGLECEPHRDPSAKRVVYHQYIQGWLRGDSRRRLLPVRKRLDHERHHHRVPVVVCSVHDSATIVAIASHDQRVRVGNSTLSGGPGRL